MAVCWVFFLLWNGESNLRSDANLADIGWWLVTWMSWRVREAEDRVEDDDQELKKTFDR